MLGELMTAQCLQKAQGMINLKHALCWLLIFSMNLKSILLGVVLRPGL